jgi:hypothetical protein
MHRYFEEPAVSLATILRAIRALGRRDHALLIVALMAGSGATLAQSEVPITAVQVQPSPAQAGEPVSVLFRPTAGAFGTSMVITRTGSVITLTHRIDFLAIGTPPPPADFVVAIGAFGPGRYTMVYAPTAPGGAAYPTQTLPFTVDANAVPAGDVPLWVLLASAALSLGVFALRRR